MHKLFNWLKSFGVIGDEREPNVIRLSPTPLYSLREDCERAAAVLEKGFESLRIG